MRLYDLIQAMIQRIPRNQVDKSLLDLSKRYQSTTVTYKNPIRLSQHDIETLVKYAINYNIRIPWEGNEVDVLSIFLRIGSFDETLRATMANQDPILGQKDKRIEHYIIKQAEQRYTQYQATTHVAVFGLSGNPPTCNHALFIKHLVNSPKYSKVYAILSAQSPLKAKSDYLDSELRLTLLKDMLSDMAIDTSRCVVETLEIDRGPPSRMVATISQLILRTKNASVFVLAMGMDTLPLFTKWYKWDNLVKLCSLNFYARPGINLSLTNLTDAIVPLLSKNADITLTFNTLPEHILQTYKKTLMLIPNAKEHLTITQEAIPTTQGSASEIREHYRHGNPGIPIGMTPSNDKKIRDSGCYSELKLK